MKCPRCGASIPTDAPEGFCLLCLVREGAASRNRASALPSLLPNRFGDYEILREIGRGGMGKVYRARQISLDRIVALKVISAGEITASNLVDRFRIEAEAAASLDHPNIVSIYEVGEQDGWNFFSMRLVEGQTLSQALERGPLEFKPAAQVLAKVSRAIQHAHERGVLHRDLKPGNVLLDAAGEPHVADFGLAKFTQRESDLTLTHTALGTPAYMSPEQAAGRVKEVTTASDVYGLGAVLFEMLTGKAPFAGESAMAIARQVVDDEPPLPSSINRAVPRDLTIICLKCLEKEPARRYPTAAALADDLERWLRHEPISAHAAAPVERLAKWIRRKPVHTALAATGVIAVIALVVGTVVSLGQARRANRAQRETTLTLADMYTRSGLTAAKNDGPTQAALWFANAAVIARGDSARFEANRVRAAAWRREAFVPIRVFETEFHSVEELHWNPKHATIIAESGSSGRTIIWDLQADRLWEPKPGTMLRRAVWDSAGQRIAVQSGDDIAVLSYPSGTEEGRVAARSITAMTFSPTADWLAVAALESFLCNWRTGERRSLPKLRTSPIRLRFSRDGASLLLQSPGEVGICAIANTANFLHPPVPVAPDVKADFLGDSRAYFTGSPEGLTFVRDSRGRKHAGDLRLNHSYA